MLRKDQRQLIICEQCGQTYPGFERENGELHVVGGPTCPNCESSSFAEVEFDPSVTLSCPSCGVEHRETVELPYDATDATTTGHDPDGIVEVTCEGCGEVFSVGYEAVN